MSGSAIAPTVVGGNTENVGASGSEAEKLAVEKARQEEKQRHYAEKVHLTQQLEEARKERERVEALMKEQDRKRQEEAVKALPERERAQAETNLRIQALQEQNNQLQAVFSATQAQLRQSQLTAYRNQLLIQYNVPAPVHPLVGGQSEAELLASVGTAIQTFNEITQQARQELSRQAMSQVQPMVAPPPSPHFVTAPTVAPAFPTPVNAQPVTEAPNQPTAQSVEQMVRSGQWAQQRNQAIGHLQHTRSPQVTPPTSYQPQPMPMQQLPQGVMQPQGFPTGQTVNPHMSQMAVPQPLMPPQTAPQMPQGGDPQVSALRAQAMEAIQRTYAGANPTVAMNGGVATQALQDTRALMQSPQYAGMSPEQVLQARFAPTPPIK